MSDAPDGPVPPLSWRESAERLLEGVPGVVSAAVEGTPDAVSEVRIWYEPTWPVRQVVEAVRQALAHEVPGGSAAARVRAVVALPDRRIERRPRPARVAAEVPPWGTPVSPSLRLTGHRVETSERGVVGVQVWIEWQGRTFSGAALGPSDPEGSLRTPVLATLRALHACLQTLYNGPMQPGLALESAVRVQVRDAPVVVVALTASEEARPRFLTAAWPDEGSPVLPLVLATLHATSRTVTRWLGEEAPSLGAPEPEAALARAGAPSEPRFTLMGFAVGRQPSGELDVGVRLAGNGRAVDGRKNGRDAETTELDLGAAATLDAVHELLRFGSQAPGVLRHSGTYRLQAGEHEVVVVRAEALLQGRRVALAGATSTEGGAERASITATLQATNPLVADPGATLWWAWPGRDPRPVEA